MSKNVLVVGSGGREHALAWKLALSPQVDKLLLAPGNAGAAREPKVRCVNVAVSDHPAILQLCRDEKIDFVVVGPDQALADGLVDFLEEKGVRAFGPKREAARLEFSKAFAKQVMKEQNIPTARFETFESAEEAKKFLSTVEWGDGWVIKADGLALGKGVVVCQTREEAVMTAIEFLSGGAMGEAGKKIVAEERLVGREVSAFSLCDGERSAFLGFACDYKRIGDGDQGPNTGGMGAFSPADWLPAGMAQRVEKEVTAPLMAAMRARGAPFKGILFTGIMMTAAGPKVLEFNARFGDPETQVLMPLLDEDLLPWLEAAAAGRLSELPASGPRMQSLHSVHVVMAAAGYPGAGGVPVRKGDLVEFPAEMVRLAPGGSTKLFFAGVSEKEGRLFTSGGRVLGLTALGSTRAEARALAYETVARISFAGAQRRSDVGS